MIKICVFLEGQSELIFIRQLISTCLDLSKVSFKCYYLKSQTLECVPYEYNVTDPLISFTLINVGNDERVLSVINDRFNKLSTEYDFILGLRDMYSRQYPDTQINFQASSNIYKSVNKFLKNNSMNNKVILYFMVMEFESWLMALNNIIPDYMIRNNITKFSLPSQNPESYFRPSHELMSFFSNHSLNYNKSGHLIESILSTLDFNQIKSISKNSTSKSLRIFLNLFLKLFNNYLYQTA